MPNYYGASVNAVYSSVKDLVNKDQQGFISPAVFNNFAQVAQLSIFNKLFDDLKDGKRLRKAGFDPGRDKSQTKRIEEDLARFAFSRTITKAEGLFEKPSDLSRIISMTTFGSILLGQSTRTPIEMCYDEEKIDRILRNNISSPTESYPIALVSNNIEVFPSSLQKITMRYYRVPGSISLRDSARTPGSPFYNTISIDGNDVFDSTTSRDFELPEHYIEELIYEIASMAGVNLRDKEVQAFGKNSSMAEQQQGTF